MGVLGIACAYCGASAYERAVECFERAIRLSPNDPWLQFFYAQRGMAEILVGHGESAIAWLQKSIQRNPNFAQAHRSLAAACALSGALEKARAALHEAKRLEPGLSIAKVTQRAKQVFKNEKDFERYIAGLRLAGAPEA